MGLSAAVRAGRGRAEGKDVSGRLKHTFPSLPKTLPGGKERLLPCCRAALRRSYRAFPGAVLCRFPYQDCETIHSVVGERDFSKARPLRRPAERRSAACFSPLRNPGRRRRDSLHVAPPALADFSLCVVNRERCAGGFESPPSFVCITLRRLLQRNKNTKTVYHSSAPQVADLIEVEAHLIEINTSEIL